MKKIFLPVICCLLFTISIFPQAKEISFEESQKQLVTAFKKENKGKSRVFLKYEYFDNGKLSSKTETVTEADALTDKLRVVRTITTGERIERFELIRVKEIFYCRKNSAAWEKSNEWCEKEEYNVSNTGEEESSKYTVEETKFNAQNAKLYRQYIIRTDGKTKTFWDYKFWVSANGFILRREIEEGSLNPQTVSNKMTETREYNVRNIKIVAPMK